MHNTPDLGIILKFAGSISYRDLKNLLSKIQRVLSYKAATTRIFQTRKTLRQRPWFGSCALYYRKYSRKTYDISIVMRYWLKIKKVTYNAISNLKWCIKFTFRNNNIITKIPHFLHNDLCWMCLMLSVTNNSSMLCHYAECLNFKISLLVF